VLQLTEMLGRSLARRTVAGDVRANVIGRFGDLLIAEAPISGTPMIGRTLADGWLRTATGLTVVGLWERGHFDVPHPERCSSPRPCSCSPAPRQQLARFTELTAIYNLPDVPVSSSAAAGSAVPPRAHCASVASSTASSRRSRRA
jgi:voltage-gated potassium channel